VFLIRNEAAAALPSFRVSIENRGFLFVPAIIFPPYVYEKLEELKVP
jgi:hypothetical protein